MPSMSPEAQNQAFSREGVTEKLQILLKDILKLEDTQSLTPDTRLVEDLGIGSLDTVDIVIAVEDAFSIKLRSVNFAEVNTLGDIADLILEQLGV